MNKKCVKGLEGGPSYNQMMKVYEGRRIRTLDNKYLGHSGSVNTSLAHNTSLLTVINQTNFLVQANEIRLSLQSFVSKPLLSNIFHSLETNFIELLC